MSERRKRLHDLLLTLINKNSEFEFMEEDSNDLTSSYSEKDNLNLSRVIEKNRKIIKSYQAIVRTAVTLDALMDSENELAMNLGETYLVTENGNERLGKQKLDLVIL